MAIENATGNMPPPRAAASLRRREAFAFRPRKLRWPNALRRDEAASHGLAGAAIGRERPTSSQRLPNRSTTKT